VPFYSLSPYYLNKHYSVMDLQEEYYKCRLQLQAYTLLNKARAAGVDCSGMELAGMGAADLGSTMGFGGPMQYYAGAMNYSSYSTSPNYSPHSQLSKTMPQLTPKMMPLSPYMGYSQPAMGKLGVPVPTQVGKAV
jgi:hypothetical protein